jgi:hypothetical protein
LGFLPWPFLPWVQPVPMMQMQQIKQRTPFLNALFIGTDIFMIFAKIIHFFTLTFVEILLNIVLIIASLLGWYFLSFKVLRYMVDASEGNWKWELAGYLILLCGAIYLLKFALYSLTHFPLPGSWSSRFFLGVWLVASYLVPFAKEYVQHFWRRNQR